LKNKNFLPLKKYSIGTSNHWFRISMWIVGQNPSSKLRQNFRSKYGSNSVFWDSWFKIWIKIILIWILVQSLNLDWRKTQIHSNVNWTHWSKDRT